MISKEERNYLSRIRVPIRLSIILPSGHPLVVSLWFMYENQVIYCATNRTSKLVTYLEQNHRVGFEVAADEPPYCGLRGYGNVELYSDDDLTMVSRLYRRYFENTDSSLYQFLTKENREEVIIKIVPEKIITWNFEERMKDSLFKGTNLGCFQS